MALEEASICQHRNGCRTVLRIDRAEGNRVEIVDEHTLAGRCVLDLRDEGNRFASQGHVTRGRSRFRRHAHLFKWSAGNPCSDLVLLVVQYPVENRVCSDKTVGHCANSWLYAMS